MGTEKVRVPGSARSPGMAQRRRLPLRGGAHWREGDTDKTPSTTAPRAPRKGRRAGVGSETSGARPCRGAPEEKPVWAQGRMSQDRGQPRASRPHCTRSVGGSAGGLRGAWEGSGLCPRQVPWGLRVGSDPWAFFRATGGCWAGRGVI